MKKKHQKKLLSVDPTYYHKGSELLNLSKKPDSETAIVCRDVNVFYGGREKWAIQEASLDIHYKEIVAMIGPSGCGKSTFLRVLNRMNDPIPDAEVEGRVLHDGEDIYANGTDVVYLRRRIGMVFQKPNPFPKSIYENVAFGPRIHGLVAGKKRLDALVEKSLVRAGLWDEVSDRLSAPALSLSGGQQQRLCIARAIAVSPDVVLMDEPCSALDPIATDVIEELLRDLKKRFAIVMVTHSMAQARRLADKVAMFHLGRVVEYGTTTDLFESPHNRKTKDYVGGRIG